MDGDIRGVSAELMRERRSEASDGNRVVGYGQSASTHPTILLGGVGGRGGWSGRSTSLFGCPRAMNDGLDAVDGPWRMTIGPGEVGRCVLPAVSGTVSRFLTGWDLLGR